MIFVASASDAPATPGAYALALEFGRAARRSRRGKSRRRFPTAIMFLRLGAWPGGLRAPLARHMGAKRAAWRVDQLTAVASLLGAFVEEQGDECALNAALDDLPIPFAGFGSSDCRRCAARLQFLPKGAALPSGWENARKAARLPRASRRERPELSLEARATDPAANQAYVQEEIKTKVEARTPRGLADREAGELAATAWMLDVVREVYERTASRRSRRRRSSIRTRSASSCPTRIGRMRACSLPGRRRPVAVAALRPDRAARTFRRAALRDRPKTLSQSYRYGRGIDGTRRSQNRGAFASSCSSTPMRSAPPDGRRPEMRHDGVERHRQRGDPRGELRGQGQHRKVLNEVLQSSACRAARMRADASVLRAIDKFDRLGCGGVADCCHGRQRRHRGHFTKARDSMPTIDRSLVWLSLE